MAAWLYAGSTVSYVLSLHVLKDKSNSDKLCNPLYKVNTKSTSTNYQKYYERALLNDLYSSCPSHPEDQKTIIDCNDLCTILKGYSHFAFVND